MHTCATICVHRKTNIFFKSFIIDLFSCHARVLPPPKNNMENNLRTFHSMFWREKKIDTNGIQKKRICQWKQNNFNLQKKFDGKKRLDYFSFCFRIMCNLVDWIKDYEYEWIWFVFKNSIKKFDCNGHCLFWEIYFIGNQENFGINYGI